MGYNPLLVSDEQFTTSSVIGELHPETISYTRLKLALEIGKLRTYVPSIKTCEEIEEAARQVGDFTALSRTDMEVLAVALELTRKGFSPLLVSDDYAVQNVAAFLGIRYRSLTTFGIRFRFKWVWYCPACKRKYVPDISKEAICDTCGTQLRRRVLKKRSVGNR